MIYVRHDLPMTLAKAIASRDSELVSDLLCNEIAEIAINREAQLRNVLRMVEMESQSKTSVGLARDAVDALCVSPKAQRGIAFLIAEQNNLPQNKGHRKTLDLLTHGCDVLAQKVKQKPRFKEEIKSMASSSVDVRLNASGETSGADSPKEAQRATYPNSGVAFLILGCIGLFLTYKFIKS